MQAILCIVVGSAVLFGVFLGFRKLSQIIVVRRFAKKMTQERKGK